MRALVGRTVPPRRFDVKREIERVAQLAQSGADPRIVSRAYASTAQRVREEASRDAKNGFALQALAAQLDQLSAEAMTPIVDPHYGEEIRTWADHPGGDYGPAVPTEWDGLVHDIAASKVNEEGEPVSELEAAARLQRLQEEQEGADATFTQINPRSVKPGVTLLGTTALIQYGGTPGSGSFTGSGGVSGPRVASSEAPVIRWDGLERDTRTVTIACGIIQGSGGTYPTATSGGNKLAYRYYAHVLWGTAQGQALEAKIDIGRGTQFRLAAAFVYCNVAADPIPSSGYVAGSALLTGTLGFFGVSSQAPVTRTAYVDGLGAGLSQTIIIPAFAQSILPIQLDLTTGNVELQFRDAGGTVVGRADLLSPGKQVAPIPLAQDYYDVVVTNNDTSAVTTRLVFQLVF